MTNKFIIRLYFRSSQFLAFRLNWAAINLTLSRWTDFNKAFAKLTSGLKIKVVDLLEFVVMLSN